MKHKFSTLILVIWMTFCVTCGLTTFYFHHIAEAATLTIQVPNASSTTLVHWPRLAIGPPSNPNTGLSNAGVMCWDDNDPSWKGVVAYKQDILVANSVIKETWAVEKLLPDGTTLISRRVRYSITTAEETIK